MEHQFRILLRRPFMTIDEFFQGHDGSRNIFEAVCSAVHDTGPVTITVSKSQVKFARRVPFLRAWRPDRYFGPGHAPLVLTFGFRHRDPSPRWKQVVEPAPGRFTHHLELYSVAEVDDQVRAWVQYASNMAAQAGYTHPGRE
jgi:hypothetical protein